MLQLTQKDKKYSFKCFNIYNLKKLAVIKGFYILSYPDSPTRIVSKYDIVPGDSGSLGMGSLLT